MLALLRGSVGLSWQARGTQPGGSPLTEHLIDVLMPTYRRPHTLPFAIESVLWQSLPSFQLHIVGDGSPPETTAVVESFDDPRIRYYPLPKAPGFGYASRNRVLRQTSASYVAYMTDDDLWFPDHLERALAELRSGRLGLVTMRSGHVKYPDLLDPHFFAFDWRGFPGTGFLRNWFTGAAGLLHERRIFEEVGYWNEHLVRFGDREFYNRVRTSSLGSRDVDFMTVLRFYSFHWDRHYGRLSEPPQKRYLEYVRDPTWRESLRRAAAPGTRSWQVRRAQVTDFFDFATGSGPRFLRFWWQKLVTSRFK